MLSNLQILLNDLAWVSDEGLTALSDCSGDGILRTEAEIVVGKFVVPQLKLAELVAYPKHCSTGKRG